MPGPIPAHLKPWMDHLAKFRKEHPKMAPIDCSKEAKKTYHKKGGNPALIKGAIDVGKAVVDSAGDAIKKGVETQHNFNKDNGNLASEKATNFNKFYRSLQHTRYWDPESIKPSLRLKKFGIDPPSTQNEKKNEEKLEKANDALYDYAEKQFEKMQDKIDSQRGKGKKKKAKPKKDRILVDGI